MYNPFTVLMAGDNFFSSHIAFGFVSKAFLDPFIENIDKKYKMLCADTTIEH